MRPTALLPLALAQRTCLCVRVCPTHPCAYSRDDEEDSDDSFSVSSSSSSDEPPDEVRDKRLWRIHARLLRKAGLQPDHATHFKLSRVTDLGKGMRKRLPRQQPGRATRFVQTFTPMPKHEVRPATTPLLPAPADAFDTTRDALPCVHLL